MWGRGDDKRVRIVAQGRWGWLGKEERGKNDTDIYHISVEVALSHILKGQTSGPLNVRGQRGKSNLSRYYY